MTIDDTTNDPQPPDFQAQLHEVFAARFPELAPKDDEDDIPPGDAPGEDELDDLPTPGEDPARTPVTPVESPAPARLAVPVPGGGEYELDVDTAQRLLSLAAWAENLDPATREQFAAIEAQNAVAIQRADYERFRAWQIAQQNGSSDFGDDDDPIDPRVQAQLQQLAEENARLRQAPLVQQYSAAAERATETFISSAEQYAAARGLSPEEMSEVFQNAVNSGVIPTIADSLRVVSPSGQLLQDADYSEVARRAFDFALVSHPTLRDRAFAGPSSGAPAPDPTAIKKARAGSLASAPSAAVPTPPPNVRDMTPQERNAAMAAELRAAMAG